MSQNPGAVVTRVAEVLKAERAAAAKRLGLVPEDAPVPEGFSGTEPWDSLSEERRAVETRGMEVYAGMVNNMDYHYGRIERFLKDIGEFDNTVVIFMSDNGPNPWFSEDYPSTRGSEWFEQFDNSPDNIGNPMSHHAYGLGWADAGAGPLNLFKLTMAEAGIRSPMLIGGPGIKESHRVDSFTYVWDVMPTILDLAGIEHPETYEGRQVERMRGRSLRAVLAGATDAVYDDEEFVSGELGGDGSWVRQGDMKAVWTPAPYGPARWQLYDLAVDPGETQDLAKSQPETLAALVAAFERYAEDVGVVEFQ